MSYFEIIYTDVGGTILMINTFLAVVGAIIGIGNYFSDRRCNNIKDAQDSARLVLASVFGGVTLFGCVLALIAIMLFHIIRRLTPANIRCFLSGIRSFLRLAFTTKPHIRNQRKVKLPTALDVTKRAS